MRNFRLLIGYDGSSYAGWQIQPKDKTVQGTIISAIEKLADEEITLLASSRTDSGVHALGQCASFKTNSKLSAKDFHRGLNSILPDDIVIKELEEVALDFDARRMAKAKSYLYRVYNNELREPLFLRYSLHVSPSLDVPAMNEAAKLFVGEMDFTSFRAAGSDAPHSVREILSFSVEGAEPFIEFRVRGTGFLRYMVRNMVATLLAVGLGEITAKDVTEMIEALDRGVVPPTAEPQGLYLERVEY